MAKIFGTVESLKTLKEELSRRGISRFNSIKEINNFISNYNLEINEVYNNVIEELDKDYSDSSILLKQNIEKREILIYQEKEKFNQKISSLKILINSFEVKRNKSNILSRLLYELKLFSLKRRLSNINSNKEFLIKNSVKHLTHQIEREEFFINKFNIDKKSLIEQKAKSQIDDLEYIKKTIESLQNKIAGAIGENLVVKEIKKLPDDFVLLNDYNIKFDPPIFNKKTNKRIYSAQIDHLLISKSGVFLLETKNWSKNSIDSKDLRSPIEQVSRANFAFYVYVSKHLKLNHHHWGSKKISVRSVIVLIKNKPSCEFEFVKIKLLNELNGYLTYFKPTLTDSEFIEIVNKLNYYEK